MKVRTVHALAAFVLTALLQGRPALGGMTLSKVSDVDCKDCNVILISLDTLRADVLGSYGSAFGASPALDQAAKYGFLFRNAYSPAPNTLSSHMTVFSSLYPSRHTIKNHYFNDRLNASHPTLAEVLKKRGYKTGWSWINHYPSLDPMLAHQAGHRRGFDGFINESRNRGPDELTAFDWIERNAANRFFIFIHNYRMHGPYTPTRGAVAPFADKLHRKNYLTLEALDDKVREAVMNDPTLLFSTQAVSRMGVFADKDPVTRWEEIQRLTHNLQHNLYWLAALREKFFWRQFDFKKAGDVSDLKTLYTMNLNDVDRWFGELYQKLKGLGILHKTLIVIMSDHGEEMFEHGDMQHTQLHEECLHIPLIFMFPSGEGKEIPELVGNIDIYPTILDLLGIKIPEGLQGMSLKPLMEGKSYPADRVVFGDHWSRSSYSVRDASRSYIVDRSSGLAEKFYDRINDPRETRDLIAAGGAADIDAYRRLLKSYLEGR